MKQVCAAAKAPIRKEDLSACHRIGAKGTTHRAIICRYISRQTQSRVMTNNKNLRGAEGFHNKIFLNEDLTRLRARLFHMRKYKEWSNILQYSRQRTPSDIGLTR